MQNPYPRSYTSPASFDSIRGSNSVFDNDHLDTESGAENRIAKALPTLAYVLWYL